MGFPYRAWRRRTGPMLPRLLATLCVLSPDAASSISFEDASLEAGIVRTGPSYGAAWGDVNGDGLPDLWVGNHGLPTLYENLGDGRFSIGTSRVQGLENSDAHGQAWADFDNDGDQDLIQVVGGAAPNFLYVNEGGLLTDRAAELGVGLPGARSRTPVWVDFDLDGRLDLIATQSAGGAFPPVALRNTGAGFQDVSSAVGFSVSTSSGAILGNLIGSTPLEILVESNLQIPAFIFETAASDTFVDVRGQLGISPNGGAAGVDGVVADFTGDLRNDVFIVSRSTNMQLVQVASQELRARMNASANERAFTFDSAGVVTIGLYLTDTTATPGIVRVGAAGTPATSFTLTLDPSDPAVSGVATHTAGTDLGIYVGRLGTGSWSVALSSPVLLGIDVQVRSVAPITGATPIGFNADLPGARPNFYVATGTNFVEQRVAAGLSLLIDAYSAVAGDFDNDMDLDLYVVCADPVVNTPNLLFENLGAGTFREVAAAGGAAGSTSGRGDSVVSADYDGDGFLDLFVTNGWEGVPFNDGPLQLFRNQGNANHWIELDLVGWLSNRDAVGARVTVLAGGVTQLREQNGGVHRFSQNHQRIHVGLGSRTVVDSVEVVWPDGRVQSYTNLLADRVHELTESPPWSRASGCGLGGELVPLLLALEACRRVRRSGKGPGRLRADS